jgi:hypothetical protein
MWKGHDERARFYSDKIVKMMNAKIANKTMVPSGATVASTGALL